MKLPDFDYACPRTLEEAIGLLRRDDAKVLAGGQSLIPMMAYRMATPGLLVDVRQIPGMTDIRIEPERIVLGGCVRWRDILHHRELAGVHGMIVEGVSHIAHYQIRNRGTVGGSLAHADPAAEFPAMAVASDATIVAAGPDGRREIAMADFLLGPLTSSLEPDEVLVEVRLPRPRQASVYMFDEYARRRGDFALAGLCGILDLADDGHVACARLVSFGASDTQVRLAQTENFVLGKPLSQDVCGQAAEIASTEIEASEDIHASAEYRRALLGTLMRRNLVRLKKASGEAVEVVA